MIYIYIIYAGSTFFLWGINPLLAYKPAFFPFKSWNRRSFPSTLEVHYDG